MTIQELHEIFPALKAMSLEKNLAMLSMVNEYGIDNIKLAIGMTCVQRGQCSACQARDTCQLRPKAAAQLISDGYNSNHNVDQP